MVLHNIAVLTVWFVAILTQPEGRGLNEQNKTQSVFIKQATPKWFRRELNVTLYQVFDEHAKHPLLLQILFVECVLVGSEGMTEQNLI